MKLSPHFTLAEMTRSQIALRHGIDNTPPQVAIEELRRLCHQILEPVRLRTGPVTVTSGYRCLELNRRLGSRPTSHHVLGRAADIQVAKLSPLALCRLILELQLPFEQLIHEYGGWTHVSIPAEGFTPKRELLTYDAQGVRAGLLPVRK